MFKILFFLSLGVLCISENLERLPLEYVYSYYCMHRHAAKVYIHIMVMQISYASTSVVLSDRSVYSRFFRTVPSDELLGSAVAAIMESYGWRQLSVFTEEQPQFVEVYITVPLNIIMTVICSMHYIISCS